MYRRKFESQTPLEFKLMINNEETIYTSNWQNLTTICKNVAPYQISSIPKNLINESEQNSNNIYYFDLNHYAIFKTYQNKINKQIESEKIKSFTKQNQSFKLVKLFYDFSKNNIVYLIAFKQNIFFNCLCTTKLKDTTNILNISDINDVYINDIFIPNYNNKNIFNKNIYILLSNSQILEMDYDLCNKDNENIIKILNNGSVSSSNEENSNKNKYNNKNINLNNIKCFKTIYTKDSNKYYILQQYNFDIDDVNIKYLYIFNYLKGNIFSANNKINLMYIYQDKYLIFSIIKGNLFIVNLKTEPKEIIQEYKTQYGSITSISMSEDGCLLGIGTEDNNVYIVNMQSKVVINCLIGHDNYVNSIIFEIQKIKDDDDKVIDIKNKQNEEKPKRKSSIQLKQFSNLEKEEMLLRWSKNHIDNNQSNDLGGTMKSKYHLRYRTITQNENNNVIYDVYTAGYDGNIGSFIIEVNNEENEIFNNNRQSSFEDDENIPTNRNIIENSSKNKNYILKYCEYKGYIILSNEKFGDSNNYHYLNKISNNPIIYFCKNSGEIFVITTRNFNGSEMDIYLFNQIEKVITPSISIDNKEVITQQKDEYILDIKKPTKNNISNLSTETLKKSKKKKNNIDDKNLTDDINKHTKYNSDKPKIEEIKVKKKDLFKEEVNGKINQKEVYLNEDMQKIEEKEKKKIDNHISDLNKEKEKTKLIEYEYIKKKIGDKNFKQKKNDQIYNEFQKMFNSVLMPQIYGKDEIIKSCMNTNYKVKGK